ncbi:MAG: GR25 family glycosyltransferase involved in LPS biosynthesis [Pontimonas sp.]|jgi:GR25 family glycosyltransferase involved in LPS biosynthesis
MNLLDSADLQLKLAHHLRVVLRHLDPIRKAKAFSTRTSFQSIERIYVINLDRKPKRWKSTRRELGRFRSRENQSLNAITRRFSAVDARYLPSETQPSELRTTFTLAEQLAVHPDPLIRIDDSTRAINIAMTKPEIAIAMSHIEVWRLIAHGDVDWTLVLEDDVIMRPGFASKLNRQWHALVEQNAELVYLAYRDVGGIERPDPKVVHRQTEPGLWEASAYLLSRQGARKLLSALPANGPIDLWMNFRFGEVRTFTTSTQIVEQRLNEPSTNSYSVLPVLSRVGSVTREKALLPNKKRLKGPIIAIGPEGTGLSSLAVALSTLGCSVAHDLTTLPADELLRLRRHGRGTAFNAFVNIGAFDETLLATVMANRDARLILTGSQQTLEGLPSGRTLHLPFDAVDKWDSLSKVLKIDYPSYPYPKECDVGQREISSGTDMSPAIGWHDLRWDRSPWIMPNSRLRNGLELVSAQDSRHKLVTWREGQLLRNDVWKRRDDTFPSNLAIFQPNNVVTDRTVDLTLKAQKSLVRDFTAGAIAAQAPFKYGIFCASLRPARGSGVITGMFLHRSGPRQEIDIEFRGKDTTKMLVNVFFNPGAVGTKLEYGYRGTPTEIDLGFDGADDFHYYEIEWRPEAITWKVDGKVVYRRREWNPTPIPDRPLEFNINIWTSRSVEFAGRLDVEALPATSSIQEMSVRD